jgi:hypothetical protein
MKRICLTIALFAAPGAFAASAQKDAPSGRFALDGASCKAKDYFVTLSETEAVLPTFSCKDVSYDQTENKDGRATYAVTAKSCVGEDSPEPREEKFTLVVDGKGAQITWSDKSKSALFLRCADK